jgi:uncharacterized DUF497 family protein
MSIEDVLVVVGHAEVGEESIRIINAPLATRAERSDFEQV